MPIEILLLPFKLLCKEATPMAIFELPVFVSSEFAPIPIF